MTPEQKADEILTKYMRTLSANLTTKLDAKRCALIAVDEIMRMPNIGYNHNEDESQYDYWQQVKTEIEKL